MRRARDFYCATAHAFLDCKFVVVKISCLLFWSERIILNPFQLVTMASAEIEEMQNEEVEALISIYEGDDNFKQVSPKVYQYKYGTENDPKSFLLELTWGTNYPNDLPSFNMDTFYNSHLVASVKEKITSTLTEEANQWLGCGMTYTLFECLKERLEELTDEQPLEVAKAALDDDEESSKGDQRGESKQAVKKEQLTKAQKRRQWERSDHEGNRARGHDWVDLIKHLSQGGNKDEAGKPPSS